MSLQDFHGFSSDRPIQKKEDDLLGRHKFSEDLADALSGWHGKDSLVVALHGEWGSGKSSIKNMAVAKLKNSQLKKYDVIEFSPWEWAAQDKINNSFFQEISKSIGRIDKSKNGKKLAEIFKKYGAYLNSGESIVSGLSEALPTLLVSVAAIVGAGGIFLSQEWIKSTSEVLLPLLLAVAAVFKWGGALLKKLGGNALTNAKDQEQNLDEIRKDITSLLYSRESPLIIVMDDLDRLTSDQLRIVFQLVKANLEFPNVVFLLLFQRDLVEEKLTIGKQLGKEYLEKIIQVPFDVPKIETRKLHELLFNRLNHILSSNTSAKEMFNSVRWANLFQGSLHIYFNSLRNVYRYTSTLSFHFSILNGRTQFEVNPVDLFAIECIRVFEPEMYSEIARSKALITAYSSSGNKGHNSPTHKLINTILSGTDETKKPFIEKFLKELFPNIKWALGANYYSEGHTGKWQRELRICHSSNFDKYFQFCIPTGELSNSDLREMLSMTSDNAGLSTYILSLQDKGMLTTAISQFSSYIDEIPIDNGYPFIKSLLDVCDRIDHDHLGYFTLSSNLYTALMTIEFLKRISNIEERGRLLIKCFKDSDGISIVEQILQRDENSRTDADRDVLLADAEFSELKAEFVARLDYLSANKSDQLLSHAHLLSFLYRWKRWGNASTVMNWLLMQTHDIDCCLKVLKAFIRTSSVQSLEDYAATISYTIDLKVIEEFVPIKSLVETVSTTERSKLDDESNNILGLFDVALTKRNAQIQQDV